MNCSNCGKEIMGSSKFCENCGSKTGTTTPLTHYPTPTATNTNQYSAPLSVADFVIMHLIIAIPFVGFIMLFVWGFGGDFNINKSNYAKSQLIIMLIAFIAIIVLFIISVMFGLMVSSFMF